MKIVKKYTPELIFLFLLLILAPVAKNITYMQNDDWIFYDNVHRFISGNLSLNPLTAPTFYTQELIGATGQMLFGRQAIPYLTLAVSLGALYVLFRILVDKYSVDKKIALLLTAYLLVNPLFSYSMWGFMTENYFLFFFLLTYYFFVDADNHRGFFMGTLCLVLAYMTRQFALVLPISFAVYYLMKKKWATSLKLFLVFGAVTAFHFFVLPKTPEMFESEFKFSNLTYFRFVFSLLYITGIYIVAFSLPLATQFITNINRKSTALFLIVTPIVIVLASLYFKPAIVRNEHFYYLNNVVQRNGFFVENLHGTKPKFMDYQLFYAFWGSLASIGAVLVALAVIIRRKIADINLILIGAYSFLLLISPKLHDRYLIPLMALAILFFCRNVKFNKVFVTVSVTYLLLMGFYSYNYTADYILTNKYVWSKSVELTNGGVDPKNIVSTSAWDLNYDEKHGDNIYKFTYDGPTQQNYSTDYTLLNVYEVKYPFRIWRNTKVYLYQKIIR